MVVVHLLLGITLIHSDIPKHYKTYREKLKRFSYFLDRQTHIVDISEKHLYNQMDME